jgi:hypothetical protein
MEGIINLTPHTVKVITYLDSNPTQISQEWTFEPSGTQARCIGSTQIKFSLLSDRFGVPVYSDCNFTEVTGLPANDTTPAIIVSEIVARFIHEHNGYNYKGLVFYPDTGPESVIRDGTGQIIGVKRLITLDNTAGKAYS